MAISWTFSHNPFVKFHGKKIVSLCYIQIDITMRCVMQGLYCMLSYMTKRYIWSNKFKKKACKVTHNYDTNSIC